MVDKTTINFRGKKVVCWENGRCDFPKDWTDEDTVAFIPFISKFTMKESEGE